MLNGLPETIWGAVPKCVLQIESAVPYSIMKKSIVILLVAVTIMSLILLINFSGPIKLTSPSSRRPHRFLYLLQTESCIPTYFRAESALGNTLECECEVLVLSWKTPCHMNDTSSLSHVEYLFNPSTTFASGRNLLYREAMKREELYLYYTILDDDVQLQMMNNETGRDKNPWKVYREFLANTEPALGVLAFAIRSTRRKGSLLWHFKRWKTQGCSMNGINESLPISYSDAVYNAFHYRAINYLMPLPEKYDAKSWWYSQQAIMIRGEAIFPGQVVVHTSVVAANTKHRTSRKYVRVLEKYEVEYALRSDIIKEIPEDYRNKSRLTSWLSTGRGKKSQYPPPICFPPLQPHRAIIPYKQFKTR